MTERPAVSVIVPCHQAQSTIVEAVSGVLAQTVGDWELVLVSDDGSSYADFLVERGISDPRIREHPVRSVAAGHTMARDRGLEIVRGAVVADLDADDVWRPERLQRLLPLALQHGAAQDVLECFDADGVLGLSGATDGTVTLLAPADVVAFDVPFHLLVRRELIRERWTRFPLYTPDPIRTAVLAARNPVAWLRLPLLRYRVSGGSMTQSIAGDRQVDAAYAEILSVLGDGDGYGLAPALRRELIAGFRRKRTLNRAHMRAAERDPRTPPFIAWVLKRGGAG